MVKYNIEGGADFYAELYKSLDVEEDEKTDMDLCLITNQPLTNNYVTLECGHKFNYIPIYKDILNHKQKFNVMEGGKGKLRINELRCPYCRKKQTELLPYYEELGLSKVNGVNFYDPTAKQSSGISFKGAKCEYKGINESFDPNKPESETNVKYKNINCYNCYASPIQLYNYEDESQPITYGDPNPYCYGHKKVMIKYYKTQETKKLKEAEKAAKQKIKEAAKAAKELEKQKLKEEKQKLKEANKKKIFENVVIGPSNVVLSENGCAAILKSGAKKGAQCGCKTMPEETLCWRHFKLKK